MSAPQKILSKDTFPERSICPKTNGKPSRVCARINLMCCTVIPMCVIWQQPPLLNLRRKVFLSWNWRVVGVGGRKMGLSSPLRGLHALSADSGLWAYREYAHSGFGGHERVHRLVVCSTL